MTYDYWLNVTDQSGQTHRIPAIEGWTVMEMIRDAGLPIKAECGGACSCATCHIYIEQPWHKYLHAPREDEIERLDQAFLVEAERSRLACQIVFKPILDGLTLTLAPGTEL